MQKSIIIILLLITSFMLKAQTMITKDTILKPGIYKTFNEFKYNNPSLKFDYKLTTKNRGYGALNLAGTITFYRMIIEKVKRKEIGKVFGFCDGENVYINEGYPLLRKKTEFSKIEYLGTYCYFKDRICTSHYTPNGSYTTCSLQQKVFTLESGFISTLTKKKLRSIISSNSDLLNKFNNESQKNKKLKKYLILFLETK